MFFFASVMFSYESANAQVVGAIKDAASKTKEVTVDQAKKTANVATKIEVVVTDSLEKAADGTKDTAIDASKKAASTSKKVGNYSVDVSENIAGTAYEGGKWFTVTTWDGTKWVSKRAWFKTKKAADETKKVISQP